MRLNYFYLIDSIVKFIPTKYFISEFTKFIAGEFINLYIDIESDQSTYPY